MKSLNNNDETFSTKCSTLKKSSHIVLRGKPCKIVEMSTAKPGKHGHTKIHLVGLDIFTGNKYEAVHPSSHNVQVPIVNRKDYQVMFINDEDRFSLMNDKGLTFSHLVYDHKICSRTIEELRKMYIECEATDDQYLCVTSIEAMGQEAVVDARKKSLTQI